MIRVLYVFSNQKTKISKVVIISDLFLLIIQALYFENCCEL